MFKAEGENWEQQKQQMANQKPVFTGRKPMNVPDHDPPPGYVCHRCYQKGRLKLRLLYRALLTHMTGHWIQACPTNDDPTYDNRPKVKRTTGIPKSFLKEVEPQDQHVEAGLDDEKRQPSGVMYDNGKQVVYMPDQASWEKFQAKAQAAAAQQEAVATGSKELQERGLECPIDKRMFVDPVKTPCCGKTYCHDCIENALVNSDLVCPNCSTEGVLIDDLASDEETIAQMKAYEEEKAAARKAEEQSKSPKPENSATVDIKGDKSSDADRKSKSPTPSKAGTNTPPTTAATPATNGSSKKRPAEEELKNDRIPTAPAAMRKQSQQPTQQAPNGFDQAFINQMNALAPPLAGPNQPLVNGNFMPFPGMSGAGFPNQNMMGMPTGMGPMMPMANGMMNPMMMQGGGAGWQGMAGMGGMGGMGYGQQPNGMYGNYNNGMMPNGGYGHQNWQGNQAWGTNGMPQQSMNMTNGKNGVFPNQQRTIFSEPFPNEEDNAYFRKPVNPHRHQNRQRRARQADYTEL